MSIHTTQITINGPDGNFGAYLAVPSEVGPAGAPGVLVLQEIFGVNSHIRSVTERFAEAGYTALAPDVFWRIRPGIELGYDGDDISQGRELKAQMNMDDAITDLGAALEALRERAECNGKPPGVVGFCYGGLLTFTVATRLPVGCASSYYGGGIADYLSEAHDLSSPLQLHFGSEDASIPADHVEQAKQALQGKPNTKVFVYPGAGHGFHCDQRGSYHADSAALAWGRTLGLFNRYLS